jgi:Ca2+-binding RTX toxin-like protein
MILCGGNDNATIAGTVDLPAYIAAEEGHDDINGGGGPNVLLGGEGDDRVTGGSNHDILVGGEGADRIVGNGGDDILIAGTLGGAADPIDQLDFLLALVVEWEAERDRTILRPKLIIGGDDDEDRLTGSAGFDWFFFELGEDVATDLKRELAENLG